MTPRILIVLAATLVAAAPVAAQAPSANDGTRGMPGATISDEMIVLHPGAGPTSVGPAANFSGRVIRSAPFTMKAPGHVSGGINTFQAGARTAWHRHPRGQIIVVLKGTGWVQMEGGPIQQVNPGDIIITPPNVRHWHGASSRSAMTQVAVTEADGDRLVEWFEKVSDGEYRKGPPSGAR